MLKELIVGIVFRLVSTKGWKIVLLFLAGILRTVVVFRIEFSDKTAKVFEVAAKVLQDGWLTRDEFIEFLYTLKIIPGIIDDLVIEGLAAILRAGSNWKKQLVPDEGAAKAISKMIEDHVIEGWEVADVFVEVAT